MQQRYFFVTFFVFVSPPSSPNIRNCLLLATNTWPFATTGTRFALPPRFGHAPAVLANICFIGFLASGLNASNRSGADGLFAGRASAQIIGLEVPFEEIEVKNPGSCPPPIETDVLFNCNDTPGDVSTLHTPMTFPPLLTTLAKPSVGST